MYGILAGPAFASTMGIMGLITGYYSDNFNRRILLGFASIFWSSTTLITAYSNTFEVILVCRMALGFF